MRLYVVKVIGSNPVEPIVFRFFYYAVDATFPGVTAQILLPPYHARSRLILLSSRLRCVRLRAVAY